MGNQQLQLVQTAIQIRKTATELTLTGPNWIVVEKLVSTGFLTFFFFK
jgi:anti-anti-sigma regulatory factor